MMGQLSAAQNALFYEFSLEHHIPDDHLLRQIDQLLDFDAIRQHLTPHYSHTGRPSIDPELMIRMLLLCYCYGIRSERRLCEEVNFNLAYSWFCRLGLEDAVPDHSTFSKNRHGRFRDSDLLRNVFNTVVTRCVEEGLVGGEGFAIDASLVRADANKQRREDYWSTMASGFAYDSKQTLVKTRVSVFQAHDSIRRYPQIFMLSFDGVLIYIQFCK